MVVSRPKRLLRTIAHLRGLDLGGLRARWQCISTIGARSFDAALVVCGHRPSAPD